MERKIVDNSIRVGENPIEKVEERIAELMRSTGKDRDSFEYEYPKVGEIDGDGVGFIKIFEIVKTPQEKLKDIENQIKDVEEQVKTLDAEFEKAKIEQTEASHIMHENDAESKQYEQALERFNKATSVINEYFSNNRKLNNQKKATQSKYNEYKSLISKYSGLDYGDLNEKYAEFDIKRQSILDGQLSFETKEEKETLLKQIEKEMNFISELRKPMKENIEKRMALKKQVKMLAADLETPEGAKNFAEIRKKMMELNKEISNLESEYAKMRLQDKPQKAEPKKAEPAKTASQEPVKTEPQGPTPVMKKQPTIYIEKDYLNISYNARAGVYDVKGMRNGKEINCLYSNMPKYWKKKDKDKTMKTLFGEEKFEKIFAGFDKKKIKNYDAMLIQILCNNLGVEACRNYLLELSCGKAAKKENLQYTMKYDLNGIENAKNTSTGNKLSILDQIRIKNMARGNQYVAKVTPERDKSRLGILAVLLAGTAAIGTYLGLKGKEEVRSLPVENIVENIEETKNKENDKTIPEGKYEAPMGPTNSKTEFMESIQVSPDQLITIKQEETKKEEKKEIEKIELGTPLTLPEGLVYQEGVSGGRKGTVGKESPTEGIYVIDHYAQVSDKEGAIKNEYGLEGKMERAYDDAQEYVHVSFVPGAKNIEEAKAIIEAQKEAAKENVADKEVIQPRGWISRAEAEKVYKQQQQMKANIENALER